MQTLSFKPGTLSLQQLRDYHVHSPKISLSAESFSAIIAAEKTVQAVVAAGDRVYGINTGFGALAKRAISSEQLAQLQYNLIQSHCCGVGENLPAAMVRLILLLKINSLARGYSGIRKQVLEMLIHCHNNEFYPCIPSKGSVGASGDLAPLAHLAAALIGIGEVEFKSQIMPANQALSALGLTPLVLEPKEGLALLNGMQVANAIALKALFRCEQLFQTAIVAGSLSIEAAAGSYVPFDARIQIVRGQAGQIAVAEAYRQLLTESEIHQSHVNCQRVQDPYSLRCQPQVMGACWDQMQYAAMILSREANAVSDNPLVFSEDQEILSGGNFHGEPIAFAADALALAIAEIAAIAERRIAVLLDPQFSGLPPFLIKESGLNSGLMISQVTAAALVSENKSLAHPASVDSIPTSANQEDHVSMATYAARRLHAMLDNAEIVIGIELLCACQGIDLRAPLTTTPELQSIHALIRKQIPHHDQDRYLANDITQAVALIQEVAAFCPQLQLK